MNWTEKYKDKLFTAEEAVSHVKSNSRIFIDGNCAQPNVLIEALAKRADNVENVEMNHLLTFGQDPFAGHGGIRHNAWFTGPGARESVNNGEADYIPIFLSEITSLIRGGEWPIDVSLINVSPPDRYGYMSYGVEVSITKPATEAAKIVIAQVNSQMPRTLGNSFIHASQVDYMVEVDDPLIELPAKEISDVEAKIGRFVADLIEDGSTLQLGIGGIPNAVLANLMDKKDLGVHTEMFSDGILPLMEAGVITNEKKSIARGRIMTSFAMGTKELYDYLDNNPLFEFRTSHYVNDPFVVAQNKKVVAVNSALEVDLTGQVCADSIGDKIYSGIGGQVDFIRGASRSEGGKPIIALPSTAAGGKASRIVPHLKPGAGVVTSRGDVRYVVTEYGVASLFGKNLRQRAEELIAIAHPDFREELRRESRWLD